MNDDDRSDCLTGDEELRFAVVLNGGVSLAVWMGGVVHELDQLTRKQGPYGAVMNMLGVLARADVITGSSAGGINGAALALGQLNSNADLSCLRDLWAEQGRMESLLHRPFTGSPSSLLRGDDFFLPELGKAMERLTRDWYGFDDRRDGDDADPTSSLLKRPIDLTVTTTLLSGSTQTTPDAFGQLLSQQRHDGRFRFFQGVDENDKDRTDFPRGTQTGPPPIARALALAARCSASFPVAFEPSFVPVNHPDRDVDYRPSSDRPDMAEYAEWAGGSAEDRSRYAVDGGLLANTPTKPALQAVERMKAIRPVKRVMLLVYPHAPRAEDDVANQQPDMPSVPTTMGNLLAALTNEGSRTFVDEVENHNRRAAVRRGSRADVLRPEIAIPGSAGNAPSLATAAQNLYPHYLRQRVRRTAQDLVQRVGLTAGRSFESVRAAAEVAQHTWMQEAGDDQLRPLPFVPLDLPDELDLGDDGWVWGTTTALDLADTALEIVALLDRLTPQLRATLGVDDQRIRVHKATATMRRIREEIEQAWRDEAAHLVPDKEYWLLRLDSYALWMLPPPNDPRTWPTRNIIPIGSTGTPATRTQRRADELGRPTTADPGVAVGQAVGTVVDALATLIVSYDELPNAADREEVRAKLDHYATLVQSTSRPALDQELARALMQLHVVSWTVGEGDLTENTHAIDLVQISAAIEHPWAASSRTLEDKLGGASLARFSGFLKASWRMNDWTWGRFDASAMLMRVLLSPARVEAYAQRHGWGPSNAEGLVNEIAQLAFVPTRRPGSRAPRTFDKDIDPRLTVRHERAVRQVRDLLSPDQDIQVLDELANLVALARHLEIVTEELPTVANAIRADQADGAGTRSRGPTFLANHETLLEDLQKPEHNGDVARRLAALDAFDRAGIGREPLDREAASDQMIRTTVTVASVGATLLDSPAAGLGRFNPVTRALRGGMRLPYWVTVGLTAGSTAAAMLAILGLAVGGALLAMTLLGVLSGPIASAAGSVGAGAAVLAFGYAAMRTGSFLHGVVLLGAAAPLMVIGAREIAALDRSAEDSGSGAASVAAVLVLTAALVVLGTLPTPLHSPLALVMDAGRRSKRVSALALGRLVLRWKSWPLARVRLVLGVVVSGVVVAWALDYWSVTTSWARPGLHRPSLESVAMVSVWWYLGVAAVGMVPAIAGGITLRTWRWVTASSKDHGPPSRWRRWVQRVRREQPDDWRAPRVSLPSGVTCGWSWVYGAIVALVTYGLVRPWAEGAVDEGRGPAAGIDSPNVWVVLGQGTAFLLLVLVPAVTPNLTARRLRRRVLKLAEAGLFRTSRVDLKASPHLPRSELIRWLLDRDLALRFLVRRSLVTNQTLVLRRRGRTLAMKVDQIRAERAPAVEPPSILTDEDAPTTWQRLRTRFRRTQPAPGD